MTDASSAPPVLHPPRTLAIEPYSTQVARWPASGQHVLAQHDERRVVVYAAFRPSIVRWAVEHGRLGGDEFSLTRMSWIKPNFLWMMYRSGWATKVDQEAILAIHLAREGFGQIVRQAVASSHRDSGLERAAWEHAVKTSDVRLQWDPDHRPDGGPTERRAIQLGLRGEALRRMVGEWTLGLEDITPFVSEQRAVAYSPYRHLWTPREDVLVV